MAAKAGAVTGAQVLRDLASEVSQQGVRTVVTDLSDEAAQILPHVRVAVSWPGAEPPRLLCDHPPTREATRGEEAMRTMRTLTLATAAGLAVLGLSGCGTDTPTQADAESQACDAITSVQSALEGVAGLDADSTVDEAKQAQQQLDDAVAGLEEAATDLKAADQAALQAGGEAISSAIDSVSGSDTIGAAGQAVASASETLKSAVGQIADGLGCS